MTLLAEVGEGADDGRFSLAYLPVREFRLWIYLWSLAFHTVVAVIITELMGRTYGKWWLWLLIAFCLPLVGPISIGLYHYIVATSVADARKQSFWERVLLGTPVSLHRAFRKEQARAQEVKLSAFGSGRERLQPSDHDTQIEALLASGKFADARARAWTMMEMAREACDAAQTERYQLYIELIAEKESLSSGADLSAPSEQ